MSNFERFTGRKALCYSRKRQTLGVPRQSRGPTLQSYKVMILDPTTGQVLDEETDAVQELVDRSLNRSELQRFFGVPKPETRETVDPADTP